MKTILTNNKYKNKGYVIAVNQNVGEIVFTSDLTIKLIQDLQKDFKKMVVNDVNEFIFDFQNSIKIDDAGLGSLIVFSLMIRNITGVMKFRNVSHIKDLLQKIKIIIHFTSMDED
jgi:hypothetical protein